MPGQPIRMNRGGQIQRFDTGGPPINAFTVGPDVVLTEEDAGSIEGYVSPENMTEMQALKMKLGALPPPAQIDIADLRKPYEDELKAVKTGREDARARGLLSAGLGILDKASQYGASQKGIGFLAGAQPAVSEYEKALANLATRGTAAQRGLADVGIRGATLEQDRAAKMRENIQNQMNA